MKRPFLAVGTVIAILLLLIAANLMAQSLDREASTVRYRRGSTVKFDAGSKMQDEDGAWTLSNAQLGKLAVLQAGTATNSNNFTVTNTFTTAFSATPVVTLAGGTNDLPHLVTVTKTNVIIGAAQTNASIRWIAIGTP